MTTRTFLAIALVGASLLSAGLATPIANADDPLAPIRAAVTGDRSGTACPAYTYNAALEAAAQAAVRSDPPPLGGLPAVGYNGSSKVYIGFGDPQAKAIRSAYLGGVSGMISNCDYTEFGVGFIRDASTEYDKVGIAFGVPAKAAPPPAAAPAPAPAPAPPVQCPVGSPTPTVPAGQTCAAPSTNSVTMAIAGAGFGKVNVTLTNSAAIDASCAYTATPASNPFGLLPTINKTVAVKAKGTATLNENSPPPATTYHVTVSCTGTFSGKNVDLGQPKQDVSG